MSFMYSDLKPDRNTYRYSQCEGKAEDEANGELLCVDPHIMVTPSTYKSISLCFFTIGIPYCFQNIPPYIVTYRAYPYLKNLQQRNCPCALCKNIMLYDRPNSVL